MKLLNELNDHLEDLNDLVFSSDMDQMDSPELIDFCKYAARLITLYEKNEKDFDEMFGPGSVLGTEIERLKFVAVTVKKAIPIVEKAEDALGALNDDVPDIVDSIHAAVDLGDNSKREENSYVRSNYSGHRTVGH